MRLIRCFPFRRHPKRSMSAVQCAEERAGALRSLPRGRQRQQMKFPQLPGTVRIDFSLSGSSMNRKRWPYLRNRRQVCHRWEGRTNFVRSTQRNKAAPEKMPGAAEPVVRSVFQIIAVQGLQALGRGAPPPLSHLGLTKPALSSLMASRKSPRGAPVT